MINVGLFSFDNENLDALVLGRGKDNMSTELEGEVVLLNLATDQYIGMDGIGSSIWNLLKQPITFSVLCQTLMEKFDVQEDVCRTDVLAFLKELAENNLITVDPEITA